MTAYRLYKCRRILIELVVAVTLLETEGNDLRGSDSLGDECPQGDGDLGRMNALVVRSGPTGCQGQATTRPFFSSYIALYPFSISYIALNPFYFSSLLTNLFLVLLLI